jgi:hypothetical protein
MKSYPLDFEELRHCRVKKVSFAVDYQPTSVEHLEIGSNYLDLESLLTFDDSIGTIPAGKLLSAVKRYESVTNLSCYPQLAAHLFAITRKPRLMNHYFPITRALERQQEAEFHRFVVSIAQNPAFNLQIFSGSWENSTSHLPPEAGYLVAGHIAEIFFYRTDLLDQFLSKKRGFYLYTTPKAFREGGGVAGGCYNPQRDAIQLVLSRLYEGFYQPTPGVAPFIHEFGHMLDHASGNRGLIPGMTDVIDSFRAGKALELERYERVRQGQTDALPIGHPYVFQNDGEFIAGYLEMFFRNPHTFAAQNPALYEAFSGCLKQDPRQYWQQDFPYYVEQNRSYYRSGQKPPKAGITLAY